MVSDWQFKDFRDFEFKSDEDGTNYVEGYAARYGNIDRAGDVIMPGAFKQALQAAPNKIRFLWGHDKNQPIGSVVSLKEDDQGLWFRAKFAPTITKAQETRELMKMDPPGIDSFSIGFRVVQEGQGQWNGRRANIIKEGKIHEISVVPFPCNEDARMTRVKSDMEDRIKSLPLDDQQLASDFIDFLEQRRGVVKHDEPEAEEVAYDEPEAEVIAKDDADLSAALQELELHRLHDALKGR